MGKAGFYGKVRIGEILPSLKKRPTNRQLVMWAAASEDFQAIHYDKEFALKSGLPNIIVHGQLECSFLDQLLYKWMGHKGILKELRCTYRGINLPGSLLYCKGKVTRKYVKNGKHCIRCNVWIENKSGKVTVLGKALVIIT